MAPIRSLTAFAFATLILSTTARFAPAYKIHQKQHKHEARDLARNLEGRQVGPPYAPAPRIAARATTTDEDVLTYITPSPGAKPIAVTEQSQYVESFVPQYTLCELPPLAFFSVSPRPSTVPVTAPYRNYSISTPPGNGTCTTLYEPTHTMVCHTTLTGLFDKWTVTQCAQDLTFSTQYGYVLVTPTAQAAAAASSAALPTATGSVEVEEEEVIDSAPAVPSASILPIFNTTNSTLPLTLRPRQVVEDLTPTPLDDLPAPIPAADESATILDVDEPTPVPVVDEPAADPAVGESSSVLVVTDASILPIVDEPTSIPTGDDSSSALVVDDASILPAVDEPTTIPLAPAPEPSSDLVVDATIISGPVDSALTPAPVVNDPTITTGPRIETLTTYYLAPWQDLTAGTVPSDIDLKVCRTFPNGTQYCVREYESWRTTIVTETATSVSSVNISTTIHGLSQVIVETFVANVTAQVTKFSLSTTIDMAYETALETTVVTTREPTVTSTSPTVYLTSTVEEAEETAAPVPTTSSDDITSTITVKITSTQIVGTRTTTIPSLSVSAPTTLAVSPSAPAAVAEAPESVYTDFASMLGVGEFRERA